MVNKCNILSLAISLLFSSSLVAGTIDVTKRGAKGDGRLYGFDTFRYLLDTTH